MAEPHSDLEAPILLIAMPQVREKPFHKSVVLLLHHSDDGSFGLVVNQPTEFSLSGILREMDIPWGGHDDEIAYLGGPVQPKLGTVLLGPAPGEDPGLAAGTQVVPEVMVTRHVEDLSHLAGSPPERFRLYLGYAGWGEGQLVTEILRNDWLTAAVDPDLLFDDDPGTTWERAMRSLGVDPGVLLSWSQSGGQTTH